MSAAVTTPPASLFVVSLPRSLSSVAYRACARALGLRAPAWTSDGEILNADRLAPCVGASEAAVPAKYSLPDSPLAARLLAWLDDVVAPHGVGYKDVVQPFVAAAWLRRVQADRPDRAPRVLVIVPDVAHVACRMTQRGWLYPSLDGGASSPLERLAGGLTLAATALESLPGEKVAYDALATDEGALHEALRRLYPERDVDCPRYMDSAFERRRRALAGVQASAEYALARAASLGARAGKTSPAMSADVDAHAAMSSVCGSRRDA